MTFSCEVRDHPSLVENMTPCRRSRRLPLCEHIKSPGTVSGYLRFCFEYEHKYVKITAAWWRLSGWFLRRRANQFCKTDTRIQFKSVRPRQSTLFVANSLPSALFLLYIRCVSSLFPQDVWFCNCRDSRSVSVRSAGHWYEQKHSLLVYLEGAQLLFKLI